MDVYSYPATRRAVRKVAASFLALGLAAVLFAQGADLYSQGQSAYLRKEYAKSAQLYLRAYKENPKQLIALYNAACSLALDGKKDEALKALEELAGKGYNLVDQMKSDTDFDAIKGETRFQQILAKVEENAKAHPPKPRWKKPYSVVTTSPDPEYIKSHLDADGSGLWLDGDVLTFAKKSSATTVALAGGVQDPLKKIDGTDLWVLQTKMDGWQKAIISYAFIEDSKFTGLHLKTWRGSDAPAQPATARPLAGKVIQQKFHSAILKEDRALFIYLPPDAPKKGLPAVFLADGGACAEFAAVLEPLILAHKVRPCAIIGIENGGYEGPRGAVYDPSKDLRAREYVPGQDPERFSKHMKFFTEEVGAYVAKEFGISEKREDRAVTGFSNGGAFSAAVAFRMPQFFGTSMPLSLGVPPEDGKPSSPLPRMFFAGGQLETFGESTKGVYEQVKGWGVDCSLDLYMAGHDPEMWHMAFANMMPKVFPPQ